MQRVMASVRVIIADDKSFDRTLEIIKSYEGKSPFEFVYLQAEENVGISKNYKRAFAACMSDYIAILEGDDYWSSPYHLQQHIDFLDRHRECSMSMNSYTILKDERNEFEPRWWTHSEDVYFVGTKEQIISGNRLGNLSACVLRTSCVHKLPNNLYDIPIADWMLGIMLSQQGLLALLKESTSVYRVSSSGNWSGKTEQQKMESLFNGAEAYNKFQNGLYNDYWQLFKQQLLPLKIRKRDYLPPFLKKIIKSCIPPAWYKHKANAK